MTGAGVAVVSVALAGCPVTVAGAGVAVVSAVLAGGALAGVGALVYYVSAVLASFIAFSARAIYFDCAGATCVVFTSPAALT